MANVVVVGAQWGDEGKGKIVDWLSERADVIARFQGGHNAGHTLVIDGTVYKLSLLPSGIVRPGKLSVIGNGVVLDPWALLAEIDKLTAQGVTIAPENLMIAENTPLILPIHGELDRARESQNSVAKIGTTGRGIGPAYEDKVGRRVIRVADLGDRGDAGAAHRPAADPSQRPARRARPAAGRYRGAESRAGRGRAEDPALRRPGLEGADRGPPRRQAHPVRGRAGLACSTSTSAPIPSSPRPTRPPAWRPRAPASGRPRSTSCSASSRPTPPGSARARSRPSSIDDDGQRLGERGHEFGTVTGRKRRCGWFDAVLVRQTCATSGVSGIALTKLDVLDGFDELKICTGYELDGQSYDYLPTAADLQARVRPVYETHEGWQASTAGARSWADLPAAAIKYVRRIEELIQCPVALLSTSPEREDTILVTDPFAD